MTRSRKGRVNKLARELPFHAVVAPRETMTYGSCESACGSEGWSGRRYYSREEKAAWLEGYAQALEAELKGVRERIKDLKEA